MAKTSRTGRVSRGARHKLGVIGAGAFTDFSLQSYREHLPNLELAAITDPKKDLATKIAREYDIKKIYPTSDQLLSDPDIDVVLILTPPNTHNELATGAVLAGKHTLVEKPIAFSEQDARQLIDLAEQRGVQLSANLVLRYHPFHRQLCDMRATDELGHLRQVTTTAWLAQYPAEHWYWDEKVSGGFFLNTFCHFLDLYDFIMDETPAKISHLGNVENGFVITAAYSDQRPVSLSVNLHATNNQESIETTYFFDKAIVKTIGWLPHMMEIADTTGNKQVLKSGPKLPEYRRLISDVMADLIKRVSDPSSAGLITHQTLLNAVINPTRARNNRLR